MRLLTSLALLALVLASCTEPSRADRSPSPAPVASAAPAVILSKLPVAMRLGQQGIRVSPNGELLLVVEREGFVHTIYDLAGRTLASHKLGEVAMNPFWLPDSSGVVTGTRVGGGSNGTPVLDLSVIELDGSLRDLVRHVSYPAAEAGQASPDGKSIAFATPCCPSKLLIVPRLGGGARELTSSPTQLRVLSWDAEGHVLYWSGADALDAVRDDGSRYQVSLGLPTGVHALDIGLGVRTADAVANVFRIQADAPFPGTAQNNIAERTLIARELHAFSSSAALPMRESPHDLLTFTSGSFGAYDITTGVTRTLATISGADCCTQPTAMSGRLVLASPGRTWVRVLDVDRDDQWHDTDVGLVLQTVGYPLSHARFLVFDEDGAPYMLDGAAARAAPARNALPAASPNETVGTIQAARNATVGRKMQLEWRLPDGAPRSLDYFGGSLVVVSTWTKGCVICTQQLGLLSDVTDANRRVEIIAVGVDETEASALEAAKDYRRLRPLVGTTEVLKELSPGLMPQTFVLDSDHTVRFVIFGPLTWDGLVRALTAASKSRLALRDGDVALS